MTTKSLQRQLIDDLASHLPYLRRYARALTGSQENGDGIASKVIEALVSDTAQLSDQMDVRLALFRVMHDLWRSSDARPGDPVSAKGREGAVQQHLSRLTPDTREALLLHTIEGFTHLEIGQIMRLEPLEVKALIEIAHAEMANSVAGRVMIIEDEVIIAMDLEALVSEMGHQVTGIARTYDAAVALAQKDKPDLILADIQLADQSSGIDAVNTVLSELGDLLVIFVTAFPERLLTGDRPEPAFLISKPYEEDQVRSAVSQAMFYSTTEHLLV